MRILLANEARAGRRRRRDLSGGDCRRPCTARARRRVAATPTAPREAGPTRIDDAPNRGASPISGLEPARSSASRRGARRLLLAQHARRSTSTRRCWPAGPVVKMMHGYFGTCVSGQKAFLVPARVGVLADSAVRPAWRYTLPRRCGRLDPVEVVANYRWALAAALACSAATGRSSSPAVTCGRSTWRTACAGARVHAIPLFAPPHRAAAPAEPRTPGSIVAFVGRLTPSEGSRRSCSTRCRHRVASLGRTVSVVMAGEGPERRSLRGVRRPGCRRRRRRSRVGWTPQRPHRLCSRARVARRPESSGRSRSVWSASRPDARRAGGRVRRRRHRASG